MPRLLLTVEGVSQDSLGSETRSTVSTLKAATGSQDNHPTFFPNPYCYSGRIRRPGLNQLILSATSGLVAKIPGYKGSRIRKEWEGKVAL